MFKFHEMLYLVTDDTHLDFNALYKKVELAIQGGVNLLQFREKKSSSKIFYEHALLMKNLCDKYKIPLIINDRIDIALAVDADGVHLGANDLPLSVARKTLGHDKIIGISARDVDTALTAQRNGASYLGVGSFFKTSTKKDAKVITKDTFSEIRSCVSIPIVAIGGINLDNASIPISYGANGIAVISSILMDENPKGTSENFRKLIKKNPQS